MNVQRIMERVALACRIAYLEGLRDEVGTEYAGHISVRYGSDRIIVPGHIHGEGRGLKDVTVDDIIVVDMNGKKVEGKHDPVEEIVIHTEIYKARPEINSVAHLHPPAALALASTDQTILPPSLTSVHFAEGVPVLETAPMIIDTIDIAKLMVKKLGKRNALIHRGHGIVTVGENLEEACLLALFLEGAARRQLLVKLFGGHVKPFAVRQAIKRAKSHRWSTRPEIWKYFENKWKDQASSKSVPSRDHIRI